MTSLSVPVCLVTPRHLKALNHALILFTWPVSQLWTMFKWREFPIPTCTRVVALQCVAGVTKADGSVPNGVCGAAVSVTARARTYRGWCVCQRKPYWHYIETEVEYCDIIEFHGQDISWLDDNSHGLWTLDCMYVKIMRKISKLNFVDVLNLWNALHTKYIKLNVERISN